REGVVDPAAPARPAGQLVPPPRGEHPFVQPLAGVAERCLLRLTFTGTETVERNGEIVDAGERHSWSSSLGWSLGAMMAQSARISPTSRRLDGGEGRARRPAAAGLSCRRR